jgi:diguanylate cyclase (GGDEF)-like protein/PAS domain S-box-containing protein
MAERRRVDAEGAERPPRTRRPTASDYTRDVKDLRGRVQASVYGAILAVLALDYFVLGYTTLQMAVASVFSISIAVVAVEFAFARGIMLRKRSTYPRVVIQEVGQAEGLAEAADRALAAVTRMLGARAGIMAMGERSMGDMGVAASAGMDAATADEAVAEIRAELREAIGRRQPVRWRPSDGLAARLGLGLGEQVVVVPVAALERPFGVLALVPDGKVGDLTDESLLYDIGMAAGISLENLRRSEGLRESESRTRVLMEQMPAVMWTMDRDLRFTSSVGAGLAGLGLEPNQVVGMSVYEYFGTDDPEFPPVAAHREALSGEAVTYNLDWEGQSFQSHVEPLRDAEGVVVGVIGVALDVTEMRRAGVEMERLTQERELILNSAGEGIYGLDLEGKATFVNPAAAAMIGREVEELLGQYLHDVLHHSREDGSPYPREECPIYAALGDGSEHRVDHEVFWRKDGTSFPVEYVSTPILENGELAGAVVTFTDISERRRSEETIRHLAYHDPLTGLPNRTLLKDRLSLALAQAHRRGQMLAVMFMDLDRFKLINDTVGHAKGDQLLQMVGERLAGLVREGDTVARVGGDEFTLILPDVTRPEDAVDVAERILATLRHSWLLGAREFRITTSIGIALYPDDGTDMETLLRNADTAMYRAKDSGRDRHMLYTSGMNAAMAERLATESDLRRAVERGEFVLHYQPQVDLSSGRALGVEALLRWQHPKRGLVAPADFIPVAEETGLIVPMGEWVLRESAKQCRRWQDEGFADLRLAVNISPRQFQHRARLLKKPRFDRQEGLARASTRVSDAKSVRRRGI